LLREFDIPFRLQASHRVHLLCRTAASFASPPRTPPKCKRGPSALPATASLSSLGALSPAACASHAAASHSWTLTQLLCETARPPSVWQLLLPPLATVGAPECVSTHASRTLAACVVFVLLQDCDAAVACAPARMLLYKLALMCLVQRLRSRPATCTRFLFLPPDTCCLCNSYCPSKCADAEGGIQLSSADCDPHFSCRPLAL
jgi:hypothetical protein